MTEFQHGDRIITTRQQLIDAIEHLKSTKKNGTEGMLGATGLTQKDTYEAITAHVYYCLICDVAILALRQRLTIAKVQKWIDWHYRAANATTLAFKSAKKAQEAIADLITCYQEYRQD